MGRLSSLRLVGSGGANRAMEAEVKRLAPRALGRIDLPKPERTDEQTLVYPFNVDFAWFAVRYLRTPSRILWDIGRTDAEQLEALYEEVRGWLSGKKPSWMADAQTISVTVKNAYSFPAGPLQIRGTVKNALFDAARSHGLSYTLDADRPDVAFMVRGGSDDQLVLSIDLGGRSLYRRGYRVDRGEAPLKENIAAQMLMLSRWDARKEVLFDPMCGAGTIPLEAQAMARGGTIWAGHKRPAASWLPTFSKNDREMPDLFSGTTGQILAGDVDADAVIAAKRNAERAEASFPIEQRAYDTWTREMIASAAGVEVDAPILVLVNPPYGERLERPETLYDDMAEWWHSLGHGVRIGILTDAPSTKLKFGPNPRLEKPMHNGPLKTRLLVYE